MKTRADEWPDFPVIMGYGSVHDLYRPSLTKRERQRLDKALARRIPLGFHKPPKIGA